MNERTPKPYPPQHAQLRAKLIAEFVSCLDSAERNFAQWKNRYPTEQEIREELALQYRSSTRV